MGIGSIDPPRPLADPARRRASLATVERALPVAVPAIVAVALTIRGIGRPSLYGTEAVTRYAARLPVPSLLHLLTHVDAVHGAYYLLMHLVLLAGAGPFVLRLPSVIGMAVAAGATANLARRLTGSDLAALFAGLALAVSPLATEYAQSGRSYAIDTAAAVITWTLLHTALQERNSSSRAWRRYSVALALTAYLHEMTLLVVPALAVTLLLARVPSATWRRWSRATGLGLALAAPVLVVSVIQDRQVSWIKASNLATLRAAYTTFLGPGGTATWINLGLISCAVVTAVISERRTQGLTLTRVALPIFVVSPVLLIGESMVTVPLYGGIRYVIWALPAMALLVGAGLERLVRAVFRGRAVALGAVAGLAVLAVSFSSQWTLQQRLHTAAGMPQDLRTAATYLHDHAHPGDGVIFAPRSFYALRLGYPHDLAALDDLVLGQSGRYGGRLYGTEMGSTGITEAVDRATRIWLVGTGSPYHSGRPELKALAAGFTRISTYRFHGGIVSLFVRRSAAGSVAR